jgi:peptidoglycan/LPS O-acetylase OafA/YrhL
MSQLKIYFPGLNGLRFIAACAVIFTHVELIKKFLGFGSHWLDLDLISYPTPLESVLKKEISILTPYISNAGPLGVIMFFVLSGFLITYLLFAERDATGKINIKQFYIRRILRIWPLYFVMLILGFFILPQFDFFIIPVQDRNFNLYFWQNLALFIFFLPNLAFSIYRTAVPNIGQLWSIGVEEQFYLIWPWFITKSKNFIRTIILFTIGILVIKTAVLMLSKFSDHSVILVLKKFLAMSKLECMSIGAMGAYILYYKKQNLLKLIYHPALLIVSILTLFFGVLIIPMGIQDGVHLLYSFCFLIIILNVSSNPKSILKLENTIFDFLGKISFGIYMYHMAVATFVIYLARDIFHFGRDLNPWEALSIYSSVLIITILVASLSYYYIEKPFIKMKKAVSNIISGENAKSN